MPPMKAGRRPADGAGAGDAPVLQRYHWLFSVQGDLLARLGRHAQARAAFERAAAGMARQ